MLTATCHCGAVRVDIPRKPRTLTSCNCSICRRYGALWAYFRRRDVAVHARRGVLARYAWGDKSLAFVRCATCGCVTHWEPMRPTMKSRMGVNARNLDPAGIARVRVRHLDGASTWKYLD
ncbi:MAG: GFA family protein [Rudaea sp.]